MYARFVEPLAGRQGRELRLPEFAEFIQSLPRAPKKAAYVEELDARLNRPEAVLLRLHHACASRLSMIAQELGIHCPGLLATIDRARELLRGPLDEYEVKGGRVTGPIRPAEDRQQATAALGEIDRMRAAAASEDRTAYRALATQPLDESNEGAALATRKSQHWSWEYDALQDFLSTELRRDPRLGETDLAKLVDAQVGCGVRPARGAVQRAGWRKLKPNGT